MEGESGLGKSALVAEFASIAEARAPNLLVLRSRSYEGERVAFKAFDGAVDQLARALRELPNPACETLLPQRATLLSQLFPVLGTVPAIAHASKWGVPADPAERRRAALACFTELLKKLTSSFEVLFAIDDLQWADAESFRLLRILVEQRESLPILIICTVRPAGEIQREVASELSALHASSHAERIELQALSDVDAGQMVTSLGQESLVPEQLQRLLQEAKGHPLFLMELVQQGRGSIPVPSALTLDEALRRRIESLEASARTLLSLVALAGKPYGAHVFARALRAPAREALVALLAHGMLRTSGSGSVAIYHDLIARVTLALTTDEQTRGLAGDLAVALEAEPDVEPSDRARLWELAGETARAVSAYEQAGSRALSMLQFTAAAQHFGRAVELVGEASDERRRALLTGRGDALARAGRSREAAHSYRAAAEGADGDAAVRLRTLAAAQAIQSGEVEWGLATARALLEELGLPVPVTRVAQVAHLAWSRALLNLGRRRPAHVQMPVTPRIRMQLEAAWALALPLSWLDPLAGAALTLHHMRIALASGEPAHMARALAAEAFAQSVRGSTSARRVDEPLARARELAREHGDPALTAEIDYREGTIAAYRWDLQRARECLERALATVSERCPDQPWMTMNIRLALGTMWFHIGEHGLLARTSEGWLADAHDRGNDFALTTLYGLGSGFVADLMADNPERVLSQLEHQRAQWPAEPFSFVHFGAFMAGSYARLYLGESHAWEWLERELPRLARAQLLRLAPGRSLLLAVRAAAALTARSGARGERRDALLVSARKSVAALSKQGTTFAAHTAPLFQAQLDVLDGERERAIAAARRVEVAARASGFMIQANSAQHFAALLEGGEQCLKVRAELLARYRDQGWKGPERLFALLCPVAAQLS